MNSLYPPNSPSFESITSTFHLLLSANLRYILARSPANKAASSPPVPALISIITLLLSSESFGKSSSPMTDCTFSIFCVTRVISDFAISITSSSSDSEFRISSKSFFSFKIMRYSMIAFAISSIFENSIANSAYLFLSPDKVSI